MTELLQRTSPAREDLCRSAPFTLTRATDEGSDGLTIEGYGAVFNSVTEINSWEGSFEEVIAPGAFKKSLRDRTPRMQFDHGQHPLLGSLPLGRWTVAEEDERGLHLVGRLTDNWLVTPFRDAIRDGGVEGMSFRFTVVRDEWIDKDGKKIRDDELAEIMWRGPGDRGPIRRTLREVKASEAGPVVWPAYDDTAVGVRSRGTVVIDLAQLRHPAQRRQLAEVVALVESATRDATNTARDTVKTLIDAGYTPDSAVAFVNRDDGQLDELKHTGKFSVQLQPQRNTETVDAPPPDGTPTDPPATPEPSNEPQPTAPQADDHPAPQAAPEVTERAAGEHSAPARISPAARSAHIKAEYRDYLKRSLALPPTTPNPKEGAR